MGYENGPSRSLAAVKRQFRRKASLAHPDRSGDSEQMQRLVRARKPACN
ncbi:MAG: curved DNA-binding protein CbpA [Gammaproteobacteria bacterium]|jgi:curved DNA-binding protein CbpA